MLNRLIKQYFHKMVRNYLVRSNYSDDLDYYRDVTFIRILIFIHPYTFIVAVSGIYYGYAIGSFPVFFWASVTYFMFWMITIPSPLTIYQRKTILTFGIYNFGFQLLVNLGMGTSGILYWTIANIIYSFFIKKKNYLLLVFLNVSMAIVIGSIIYYKQQPVLFSTSLSLPDWILIALNNLFLSIVISVLVNELVESINRMINNERRLKIDLLATNKLMENSNHLLNQKNKELEQMAYVIAHDLQEPVRMIGSFTSRLQDKYVDKIGEVSKKQLLNSKENVDKIRNTIIDLLEFSTFTLENKTKERFYLEKIIHQILIEKNIEFIPKVKVTGNKEVSTYLKPLTKLFDIIISNAISRLFHPALLKVSISCNESDGFYHFIYSDNQLIQLATIQEKEVVNEAEKRIIATFYDALQKSKLLANQLEGDLWQAMSAEKNEILFKIPIK